MMPAKFKVYYQLTKPGIVYGNILTTIAGFFYASVNTVGWSKLLYVAAGTSLTIASACVLNNVIDRDIDSKMERTSSRSLVTGSIKVPEAIIFGTLLGLLGFIILALKVNWVTFYVGLVGLIDYVILYGYSKRRTIHGTLIGSIAGATPIVAGYTAIKGNIDINAILLFTIMAVWQMPHFYAIAIYRINDYRHAKLPVWSVRKGIYSTKVQILGYLCLYLAVLLLLSTLSYAGYTYLAVMFIAGILWIAQAAKGFNNRNSAVWARGLFKTSLIILCLFSVTISLNKFIP